MDRTILQVPISASLRKEAEKEAEKEGFSSLQEAIRVFLKKLAEREISFTLEKTVQLSKAAIARYNKITADMEAGKNVYAAKDIKDLMRQLNNAS